MNHGDGKWFRLWALTINLHGVRYLPVLLLRTAAQDEECGFSEENQQESWAKRRKNPARSRLKEKLHVTQMILFFVSIDVSLCYGCVSWKIKEG